MNYETWKRKEAAKRREDIAKARSQSKNMIRFFEQAHGITETTKLAEKTMKTAISVNPEAKTDLKQYYEHFGLSTKLPESKVDPNRAFKESKQRNRFFSNDLDISDDDDDIL